MPEGKWINLFSGMVTDGAIWIKEFEVPLAEMPVWVRFGAKIPFYPESINCTDEIDLSKFVMIAFDDTFKGLDKSIIGKMIG